MSKNLTISEENQELTIEYESKNKIFKFWRQVLLKTSSLLFISPFLLPLLLLIIDLFIPLNNLINPKLFNPFFSIKIFFGLSTATFIVATLLNQKPDLEDSYTIVIKVNKYFVTVKHQYNEQKKPTIKTFESKSIKRIFLVRDVHEFISKKDERANINLHTLWIENYDGTKTKVLSEFDMFGKHVEGVQSIMEISKDFLHQKLFLLSQGTSENIPRRKISKEQDLSKLKIKDLRKDALLDYKLDTWTVVGEIQNDWRQGSTDMIYQLRNATNKKLLISVCQNMAVYTIWVEEYLTYHGAVIHKLNRIPYETPLEFTFQKTLYFKDHVDSGYAYVGDTDKGIEIQEWKYISEDGKRSLRILKHEDEDIIMFSGVKAENFEFSNILIS